jgi:hypothetical protein
VRLPAVTHTLYLGHDNEQALLLERGGSNIPHDEYEAITRIRIDLRPLAGGDTIHLDSVDHPALFLWGGDAGDRVIIEGAALPADLPPAAYRARLIAYSPAQPSGIVFVDHADYHLIIRTGGEAAGGVVP